MVRTGEIEHFQLTNPYILSITLLWNTKADASHVFTHAVNENQTAGPDKDNNTFIKTS